MARLLTQRSGARSTLVSMSPVFAGEAWRGGGRACISRPTNCTPARRVPRMLRVPRVVGSLVGWAVRARSAFWCWFQPGLRGCVLLAKATGVQGGAENTAPRRQLKKKKNKLRLDSRDADRSRKRKKETICKSRQECGSSRQRSPSSSSWLSRAVDCDLRYGTTKLVALPIRFAFPPRIAENSFHRS
jgi:hypothetical protein